MRTFEKKLEKAGFEYIGEVQTIGGLRHYTAYRNDTSYDFYVDMFTPRTFYTYSYRCDTDPSDFYNQVYTTISDLKVLVNFESLEVDDYEE